MSKISLEPNASGAGTFTLAAPNSNTNRTLNLPDEAGKLLSTGNNNPAEVFKQSNILGTVSESGGVPTGAIIERGSNANGEFVRYADGTQICTRNTVVSFEDLDFDPLSYPIEFASNPSGSCSIGNIGLPASALREAYGSYYCRARGSSWFHGIATTVEGQTDIPVTLIAIGRWY